MERSMENIMKQRKPNHSNKTAPGYSRPLRLMLGPSLAMVLLATVPGTAQVVTDNFDSGVLDTSEQGWQVRNICQPLGGYVNDSFPANGAGKALRLQRGSFDGALAGVPQSYGTGRAWLFRTNDYSDFYVAMDLVNWNDATNQSLVLLARGGGFDDAPYGVPGLGAVNGYVVNYDPAQDGTSSADRFGGELQINLINNESPSTIAAAETT